MMIERDKTDRRLSKRLGTECGVLGKEMTVMGMMMMVMVMKAMVGMNSSLNLMLVLWASNSSSSSI